jgi:hypothetical protein
MSWIIIITLRKSLNYGSKGKYSEEEKHKFDQNQCLRFASWMAVMKI